MQAGERELHLGLDACDTGDATPRSLLGDVVQQRRLADPRLAAHDQHRALPGADALQLAVQRLSLVAASLKHGALSLSTTVSRPDWATSRGDWGPDGALARTRACPAGSRLAPCTPPTQSPPPSPPARLSATWSRRSARSSGPSTSRARRCLW